MGGRFILLRLALRSLWSRSGLVLMTAFAIAVSIGLLLMVEKLRGAAEHSFRATISGTHMVVGARSGAVELVLYAVFRLGSATNNMTWESYEDIKAHPDVEWIAPISLGDGHRGFRVVGTDGVYFEQYRYRGDQRLELAEGALFEDLFDAVIGADVAERLGYQVGDSIVVSHGIGEAGLAEHDDLPFRVSGILAKSGTPADRAVHVTVEAITAIHVDWSTGARKSGPSTPEAVIRAMDLTPKTVTAALVRLKSPLKIFSFSRFINGYDEEPLSAVVPGQAISQLWTVVGQVEQVLSAIMLFVVIAAAIGMSVMLTASLAARRREMAILRSVGARPSSILGMLMLEAIGVVLLGAALGVLFYFVGLWLLTDWIDREYNVYIASLALSARELQALGVAVGLGALAGLPPAIRAYRMSLSDGVAVRE